MKSLGCVHRRLAVAAFAALTPLTALGGTVPIAISGQTAPGVGPGVNFGTVLQPVLNDLGEVMFGSVLTGTDVTTGNDRALWRGSAAGPILVLRKGAAAPGGGAGVVFGNFDDPALSDTSFVFDAALAGTGITTANDAGVWTSTPFGLSLVARAGSAAPGTPAGVVYNFLGVQGIASRHFVFLGSVAGPGVTSANNQGLWRASGVGESLVMREGDQAPGTPAGVVFTDTRSGTSINSAGTVCFVAGLVGAGVNSSNDIGMWISGSGATALVMREGDAAPGTPAGTVFGGATLTNPLLNDAGQIAFMASLSGPGVAGEGIWRGLPGALQLVVREGSPAPGLPAGVTFDALVDVGAINASGQVLIRSQLAGLAIGGSDSVWRANTSGQTLIARTGVPLPGTSTVLTAIDLEGELNDGGQVLFRGTADRDTLFLGDGEETVEVVRVGQPLAGSDVSTLSGFRLEGGVPGRGHLNNFGQVVFRAALDDFQPGIFLFTPELRWRRTTGGQWSGASNWTLSIAPGEPHNVSIDPAATLTVSGPATDVAINSLTIGGGLGIATLNLQQGAAISARAGITIEPNGILDGDGVLSGVVTNNGTVRVDNLTAGQLNNHGLITGTGRIHATLVNHPGGIIRVTEGQVLTLDTAAAALNNQGRIESIGGEIRFGGRLDNPGVIHGRDMTLRFEQGLLNTGDLNLSFGVSDLFGDITNRSGGQVILSGQSRTTFYDDFSNNSGAELRVSDGSVAVFFGTFINSGVVRQTGTKFFEGGFNELGPLASGGVSVLAPGTSSTAMHVREESVTVSGHLRILPNGAPSGVSRIGSLSIDVDAGAVMDLTDNDLIVTGTPLTEVTGLIASARGGATPWQGPGLGTSTASAITGLAAVRNDRGDGTPLHEIFGGLAVAADDVLVKFTYTGDADVNGRVDAADYFAIDRGRALGLAGYANGDFDYSGGAANAADYMLIDRAFLGQGTALASAPSVSVPEAAFGGLGAMLAASLARRRGRSD